MDVPNLEIKERIQRLTAIRKQLGWSEEVCAYQFGVTYWTLNRRERGESTPKSRVVLGAVDRFIVRYGKSYADLTKRQQTGGS